MPVQIEQKANGVVEVILANPARRNALTHEMFLSLAALWPRLGEDPAVRAIVLRGEGPTFCAGADLSADLTSLPGIDDLIDRALLKTAFMPKPLIAAIRGACVAGGLELALAADIRIAAHDAVLGLPEVRWGIMPSGGGAMKLIDQIGQAKAMDLLFTGRLIDGLTAEGIGLITTALPAEDVYDQALATAQQIAKNSPVAVQAAKRAALETRMAGYCSQEPAERQMVAEVRRSGHPRIGIDAFLSKRIPDYPDS